MSPISSTLANGSAYGYRTLAAAAASSYESIASVSPTSGSSITFSSIPATYTSLQIRYNFINSAATSLSMRFNGNSSAVYDFHGSMLSDGATVYNGNIGTDQTAIQAQGYVTTVTTYPNVGIIDIHEYASTTKNKVTRHICGGDNNSTAGSVQLRSGDWRNTAAITSIELYLGTGTYSTGSVFSLYGIKGA